MKTEKPEWMKLKERHDGELIQHGLDGTTTAERPRSRGCMYGPEESLVDQVGDGLINVNDIMKRFEKMPTVEELQAAGISSGGFYGDFTTVPDYEEALQIAKAANDQFALLPAHVRGRFENNPTQFLAFVTDPKNGDECIRMGLKKAPEPKKEPDVTLKDVRDAIQGAAKPKKPAPKGGDSNEE